MARIEPVTHESADPEQKQVLDTIKSKFGSVPNVLGTLAQSPAAAKSYFAFSEALSDAKLDAKTREQVALAIAGANNCGYCASAHTAIGGSLGLAKAEAASNIEGRSDDPRTNALLTLARELVNKRGFVSDDDLASARNAGVTDPEIIELTVLVAYNTLTNYVNHVAETAIDFPEVKLPAGANA